jgi:multidrug efflux pump
MFGLSLDFVGGGYAFDSPTALWWKQLATAVVFGLGIATVLTLVFTPAMLALRIWAVTYVLWIARALAALSLGRSSRTARDFALARAARRARETELVWPDERAAPPVGYGENEEAEPPRPEDVSEVLQASGRTPLRAAE